MSNTVFNACGHTRVEQLLAQHSTELLTLVDGLGSPLHVILPAIFAENIAAFNSVFQQLELSYQILFAKKANKAQTLARQCAVQNIGMDVASVQEFEQALAAGLNGNAIAVSGPHKSLSLLQLALAHNALIAIDSIEELRVLVTLCNCHKRARLMIRVTPRSQKDSRFGLSPTAIEHALALCLEYQDSMELVGFSTHLSGYSLKLRSNIGHELVNWVAVARDRGLDCRAINLGGGLPVNYLTSDNWQQALSVEQFHSKKRFDHYYPYYHAVSGAQALRELLLLCSDEWPESLAARVKQQSLTIIIEPGRALLDQAGISLFEIQGLKRMDTTPDYYMLTAAGMSFSLSEQWFNSEFIPSPRLLARHGSVAGQSCYAAVAGVSCLESDMISWRKIPFQQTLQVGDVLAYINTAGYQMDSNESEFHSIPLPRKVSITEIGECFKWELDNK